MKRLKTTRRALLLYGTLLVLPTLVFGWLYWRELVQDYRTQLADVPKGARSAAEQIVDRMHDSLEALLRQESKRRFFEYSTRFNPPSAYGDELVLQDSPVIESVRPEGIIAWFSFRVDLEERGDIDIYPPDNAGRKDLIDALQVIQDRAIAEPMMNRMGNLEGMQSSSVSVKVLAAYRGHDRDDDLECLRRCSRLMEGEEINVGVSHFKLEFFMQNGRPQAVAWRRILAFPGRDLAEIADCLGVLLGTGFTIQQGFVIDPYWLFRELPLSEAQKTLSESQELLILDPEENPYRKCEMCAHVFPVLDLGFDALDPNVRSFGELEVAVSTDRLRARFEHQSRRFLGVAGMLVLTLATGMLLLYRSVNRELSHAQRMQDFVAAVTHELRTPLSTIRLHGEMLLDGWAVDPVKQREYYARIVRETNRLGTLVERVLEKSRLKEGGTNKPQADDLNPWIEQLAEDLKAPHGGANDLIFDLAPDLPRVWLTPDGITAIVSNLVENARKYAPVPPGGEALLLRTRADRGKVLLELLDRGPGIPSAERERIFEAFYRIGSEATRTATGTGLGLHLVQLHAEAAGAKVSVKSREGGGSIFQVAFDPVT